MASINNVTCYTNSNESLTKDAIKSKNSYMSYGKMKAQEYAKMFTSDIKHNAAEARRNGYMTVREKMKLAAQSENA